MREILPAENLNVEEFYNSLSNEIKEIVNQIRKEKNEGTRKKPSNELIDKSKLLTSDLRKQLIDKVAELVDENIFGRSEMCIQFAELMTLALKHLGLNARMVLGNAIYSENFKEIFRWRHAWVRIDDELIDGNQDSLSENPMVPKTVKSVPYWGGIKEMPTTWRLQENKNLDYKPDPDVKDNWFPDLLEFIKKLK